MMKIFSIILVLFALLMPSIAFGFGDCGSWSDAGTDSGYCSILPSTWAQNCEDFSNFDQIYFGGVAPSMSYNELRVLQPSGNLLYLRGFGGNNYVLQHLTWTDDGNSDCLGPPAHCLDGGSVPTGDETGIDCGGSCPAACVSMCPDGWTPEPSGGWFPEGKCFGALFPPNLQGICPDNTVQNQAGSCVGIEEPFLVADTYTEQDILAIGIQPTDYSFQGDNVFTDETHSWVSVDNGDGTSTETTITTIAKTDSSGNPQGTETTTRTDIVNNTTNQIISSTISTNTTTTPDENPDNFLGFGDVATGDYDADITADLPEESSMTSLIDGFITTSPIFTALDTFQVQTSGAVCSIDLGTIYDKTITMDVCQWEDDLTTFGLLFLSIVQAYSLLVIYRGWK